MIKSRISLFDVRNLLASGKTIYELPLRVTYYARVSTDKYEQLNSLGNQTSYYDELIKTNSNWVYIDGYVDEGISGTGIKKRESFLRMIRDAKLHKFDLILTKEISRFSRNTLDSIKYTEELLKNDIGVFFECDNINTFMPDSELRLTIMASMAQEEVRKLSERVKFGFQRSIKSGHVLGNSAIWGYKKNNCKLIIDEYEAEIIRKIFDMYVHDHLGMRAIGNRLIKLGYKSKNNTPFSANTIRGIITNPKYKGYYCGNKTRVVDYKLKTKAVINEDEWLCYKDEENVPQIVSEKIWDEAQKILKSRGNKIEDKKTYTNRYSFSGKIFCCEHNVTYRRKISISSGIKRKKKITWVCGNYLKHGISFCNSPILCEDKLKEIIIKIVNKYISNKDEIVNALMKEYEISYRLLGANRALEDKKVLIDSLKKKKDILLELRVNEQITNDEFKIKNDSYNNELKQQNDILNTMILKCNRYDFINSIDKLKSTAKSELKFNGDSSDEMIYALLDKIYVSKISNNRNEANLDIYFKLPIDGISLKKVRYTYTYYTHD